MTRTPRADARRSRSAILDAAVEVFGADPEGGLEKVAAAAGVTRQTVYAHFPSRDRLLTGVLDHLTGRTVEAMDAADTSGPAFEALLRLLAAAAEVTRRHPDLMRRLAALPVTADADHDRHGPLYDRIALVIARGRDAGEFDPRPPVSWLVSLTVRITHAAEEERMAGRMTDAEARDALRDGLARVLAP